MKRLVAIALAAAAFACPAIPARADTGGTCIYQASPTAPPTNVPALPLCTATRRLSVDAGTGFPTVDAGGRSGVGRITTRTVDLSGTYTATSTGGTLSVGWATECSIASNVTAVSGTSPTLTPTVDVSLDGGTTWVNGVAAGAAITATGTQWFTIGLGASGTFNVGFGDTIRVRAVIGGTTPSFTVSILAICK